MTERKPQDEPWDSFVERQIREAQEQGAFDLLPGFGRPIEDIDEPYDELWWVKKKMRRERLSVLPPALQIRLDVEKTLESLAEMRTETTVRKTLEALNERIRRAHFSIAPGPPCTTLPVDVEQQVERWRRERKPRDPQ